MAKTIQVRVDDDVKDAVERVLSKLGLDMSTAIRIYLAAILWNNGIPFDLKIPYNAETLAAMHDARDGRNLYGPFHTFEEMMTSVDMDEEDVAHRYKPQQTASVKRVAEESDYEYDV